VVEVNRDVKRFTLTSIVSVAGAAVVAIACSSSETGSGGGGDGGASSSSGNALIEGGSGGGKCEGEGNINVAASSPTGGDGGGADGGACPVEESLSSADLDKAVGWHCPAPKKGACTAAEIDTISKNLDDTNVKSFFDITNGVGDACKACAVSKDTDAKWAPIVGIASTNGESGILNYGACFGHLIGASCGRSVQYSEFCFDQACGDCATSQTERTDCVKAASAGTCKGFVDSIAKECPLLANFEDQCSDIVNVVKVVCGS